MFTKFSWRNAWVAVGPWVLNKATRSEELSNNYIAVVYFYCNTGEEIVYVNLRINQAIGSYFKTKTTFVSMM